MNDYRTIAKEALEIEAHALINGAAELDGTINEAVALILSCKGKLIVTGVGKSGLIGAKIAATFASTGTPSFFLHPTEALHGDLGMISENDMVLAISYSGESEELSQILPHIKRFDIPLIGLTKNPESTLGRQCDVVLKVVVDKEACPLNIAPTSSTTLSLALGDAVAICLMVARGFKKEDFASYHPGGALGKRLFVKVEDLMIKASLPLIDQHASMKEAIVAITEGRLGTALLCDGNRLVAIISDGDVRRALLRDDFSLEHSALEYATKEPKVIEGTEMLASEALVFIEQHKIQIAVIVDANSQVLGVLHLHKLVEEGIAS